MTNFLYDRGFLGEIYGVCIHSGGIYKKNLDYWRLVSRHVLEVIAIAHDLGSQTLPLLWVCGKVVLKLTDPVITLGDESQLSNFIWVVLTRFPGSVDMAENSRRLVRAGGEAVGDTSRVSDWLEVPFS